MERYVRVKKDTIEVVADCIWSEHILTWETEDHFWVRSDTLQIGDKYEPGN